jgi:hypothetical protein
MNREERIQLLGSLYLLYKFHTEELQKVGYTSKEAFWLNFTCLPFLPWDQRSQKKISLTEVLRLYLGTYQYNTNGSISPENVPAFLELLVDRYKMAKDIVSVKDQSQIEIQLGRLALPEERDVGRLTKAASIVLHTISEWQSQIGQDHLPWMLVEDIGDTTTD